MNIDGYIIFDASGHHITKGGAYNRNGVWNYTAAFVFPFGWVEKIKKVYKGKPNAPVYKQYAVFDSNSGIAIPKGGLELLWDINDLGKKSLFALEMNLLMTKYGVKLVELTDWQWGDDGDEEEVSMGYSFSDGKSFSINVQDISKQ